MTSARVLGQSRKAHPAPTTLGQRIRVVRISWGWTQVALAETLGSSQSLISEWEKNVSRPSAAALKAIARLFHLSADALVTGEKFSIPDSPDAKPHGSLMSKREGQELRQLLPDLPEGKILQVNMGSEASELVVLKDALAALRQAMKEGRPVWLIIGETKSKKPPIVKSCKNI